MTGRLVLPQRHQRRRTGGWRKPVGAVIVDRTTRRWGNPFRVGDTYRTSRGIEVLVPNREFAVGLYQAVLAASPEFVVTVQRELGGRDLCCPCPLDECCHADVLIACSNTLPYWQVIPPEALRRIVASAAA